MASKANTLKQTSVTQGRILKRNNLTRRRSSSCDKLLNSSDLLISSDQCSSNGNWSSFRDMSVLMMMRVIRTI